MRRVGPSRHWPLALAATLGLNLGLFLLLPQLVQTGTPRALSSPALPIQIVSRPRQAPPPPQQAAKEPPPRPQPPQALHQMRPDQPVPQLQLDLPLQPELPSLSQGIVLPDIQRTALAPLPSVFDSSQLDQPLQPLAQSPFVYPMRAKRLGIEGSVRVELLVDKQGQVEQVKILDAQPSGFFEQTVERGIRLWRFNPGTVQGEPVRSRVTTTIRFELED
ncbi:MAG: energy transducer TonB [Desulfuromonadaceae bacterium]|nr:energy transducer TonB [Desulfuromonadaceae bacterium]